MRDFCPGTAISFPSKHNHDDDIGIIRVAVFFFLQLIVDWYMAIRAAKFKALRQNGLTVDLASVSDRSRYQSIHCY